MILETHDFLFIRRPLLSKEKLFDFHRTVNNDPKRFQTEILSLFSEPVMREAIFLASPSLSDQLSKAISCHADSDQEKLCYSLYKYFVRMCTRCTPFGLFAGCLSADIKSTAPSNVQMGRTYTHFSLDSSILWALNCHLQQKESIRGQLRFFPNTSMYQIGGCYKYIGRHSDGFTLSEAEANKYTQSLISIATKGASITEMIGALATQGVKRGAAAAFVHEMIQSQILVSDFEPSSTGGDWLQTMIKKLVSMNNTGEDLERLSRIARILQSCGSANEKSDKLFEILSHYGLQPTGRQMLKADQFWDSAVCNLQQTVIDTLLTELKELSPLSQAPENRMLSQFAITFRELYQEKEMPLLVVLDHEDGIGYGNLSPVWNEDHNLLEGIEFPYSASDPTEAWPRLRDFKLRVYQDSITQQRSVVQLTKKELSGLAEFSSKARGAEGLSILGTLITNDITELDQGKFKFIQRAAGSVSGFNLLSRFCLGDSVMEGLNAQGIAREEFSRPDLLFAEINHLPDPNLGNIITRPGLRKYEIPYLSASTVDTDNQIVPSDLLISVTADHRVILRSKMGISEKLTT
jgi:lantibiotic biosynthesis protein